MVVRLHNINKWALLPPGSVLALHGESLHRVRVSFNAAAPTRIDLVEGDDVETQKVVFVAAFQGREDVEFVAAPGAHLVATSDSDVFFFTDEGSKDSHEIEQASFTKLATRRARNPQLEMMMFKMQQNINRRLDLLAADQAAWQAAHGADPETGEVDDEASDDTGAAGGAGEGEQQPPAGAAAAPAQGAAGAAAA